MGAVLGKERERRQSARDNVVFGEDSECWFWLYSFVWLWKHFKNVSLPQIIPFA